MYVASSEKFLGKRVSSSRVDGIEIETSRVSIRRLAATVS